MLPGFRADAIGLTKSFDGREVVRNLSMQVKRGTIFGFLGPNGSGKTTTIRMLTGLLTPDEGEGTCLGYDIRSDARAKYGDVVAAVDEVRSAGVDQLGLLTQKMLEKSASARPPAD